jgi:hypothetical protein
MISATGWRWAQREDPLRPRTSTSRLAVTERTWLDRELTVRDRSEIRESGFGGEVNKAMSRRAQRLMEMGLASAKDGAIHIPSRTVATLERLEVERVGRQMARERGLAYRPNQAGEYVTGRLAGIASLASGRFARSRTGSASSSCPGSQSSTNVSASTSPAFSATTAELSGARKDPRTEPLLSSNFQMLRFAVAGLMTQLRDLEFRKLRCPLSPSASRYRPNPCGAVRRAGRSWRCFSGRRDCGVNCGAAL